MTGPRCLIRRFGSAIVLTSALLLVGTLWIAGTHYHGPATAHTCAVCISTHAPAVISIAANVAVPRPFATRVEEISATPPVAIALGLAPSRAPPLS